MKIKKIKNLSLLILIVSTAAFSFLLPADVNSNTNEKYSFVCCGAEECSGGNECTGEGQFNCCFDQIPNQ